MTGALGIFVLIFAQRLKAVVELLVYHWGNSPPQVERIKTIRVFLTIMSITFLLADFVYNIIGPSFDVINAITETRTGRFDNNEHMMGNSKLQLMLDMKMQIVLLLNL